MNINAGAIRFLVADDDADDRFLMQEAFDEARLGNPLDFVENGEELVSYLKRENGYADLKDTPLPGVIFLDLNMPRMDGREALAAIKADKHLRHVPVVVFTTSQAEEDIFTTYDLGVSGFIVKPVTFEAMVETIQSVTEYWMEVVRLPPDHKEGDSP
ncbi:MAG: response regulator [Magnetovibrio sp.]|nr:response regulator [Magnetovibrio sp.]